MLHSERTVASVARALSDSAAALDVGGWPGRVADEVERLVTEPLGWYISHPSWPSRLTPGGVPLEISLTIDGDGDRALGVLVDTTDHRAGAASNRQSCLDYARRVTGVSAREDDAVSRLLGKHLDGIADPGSAHVVHGIGYGPSHSRHATLFFATGGLTHGDLEDRLPEFFPAFYRTVTLHGGLCPPAVAGVAYDLDADAAIVRTKAYASIRCGRGARALSTITGTNPELEPALALFDRFRSAANAQRPGPYAFVSQWSLQPGQDVCRHELLFSCADWSWNLREGFLELIQYLSTDAALDLRPLYAVLGVFARHGIPLRPCWFGIRHGQPRPAGTFHFSPVVEHEPPPPSGATFGPPSESRAGDARNPGPRI